MSPHKKIVTVLIVLALSIGLGSGLATLANNNGKYKTFESEEFRFSISYPEDWNKEYSDENGELSPTFA